MCRTAPSQGDLNGHVPSCPGVSQLDGGILASGQVGCQTERWFPSSGRSDRKQSRHRGEFAVIKRLPEWGYKLLGGLGGFSDAACVRALERVLARDASLSLGIAV
jgi:hypothetical protein